MRPLLNQLGAGSVEHGTTRASRWLSERWLSFGAWLAVVEGALVLFGAFSKWYAAGVALLLLAVYFTANRASWPPTLKIAARILALSQVLALFIPLLLGLVVFAAVIALVLIGLLALFALLRGR